MTPKKSTLINMLLTLFVISVLSAISLSYVYEITKEPIKKAKREKMLKAIKVVSPEFDNNLIANQIKIPVKIDTIRIFPCYNNNKWNGATVLGLSDKAYNGVIKIMVGVNLDKTIRNVVVLEQKETPGLGSKVMDTTFLNQFINKNPEQFKLKVKKDGGDVDAISGATITSRAFSDALQNACNVFKQNINKMKKNILKNEAK